VRGGRNAGLLSPQPPDTCNASICGKFTLFGGEERFICICGEQENDVNQRKPNIFKSFSVFGGNEWRWRGMRGIHKERALYLYIRREYNIQQGIKIAFCVFSISTQGGNSDGEEF